MKNTGVRNGKLFLAETLNLTAIMFSLAMVLPVCFSSTDEMNILVMYL